MNSQRALSKTIFILSDNRDFIEPLSSLVTCELGISCKSVVSEAEIKEQGASLLVSDKPVSTSYKFPVITVNLPVRIKGLISDIKSALEYYVDDDLFEVYPGFKLTMKYKTLTHTKSGISIDLTDKESQLLQLIAQEGNSGISKEVLLKEVWGFDSALDTHTLETHIYRLRKKIRDNFDIEMIKAFEGGYKL
jgi:hypothetical protein